MSLLTMPSRADFDALAVDILTLAVRKHLDEPTMAVAMADALGHLCATLDLKEGRRDLAGRLHEFTKRVEETYARSIQMRSPRPTDVHGRPL